MAESGQCSALLKGPEHVLEIGVLTGGKEVIVSRNPQDEASS